MRSGEEAGGEPLVDHGQAALEFVEGGLIEAAALHPGAEQVTAHASGLVVGGLDGGAERGAVWLGDEEVEQGGVQGSAVIVDEAEAGWVDVEGEDGEQDGGAGAEGRRGDLTGEVADEGIGVGVEVGREAGVMSASS